MDFLRWTIQPLCDKVVVLVQSRTRLSKRRSLVFPHEWVPVDLVVCMKARTRN